MNLATVRDGQPVGDWKFQCFDAGRNECLVVSCVLRQVIFSSCLFCWLVYFLSSVDHFPQNSPEATEMATHQHPKEGSATGEEKDMTTTVGVVLLLEGLEGRAPMKFWNVRFGVYDGFGGFSVES